MSKLDILNSLGPFKWKIIGPTFFTIKNVNLEKLNSIMAEYFNVSAWIYIDFVDNDLKIKGAYVNTIINSTPDGDIIKEYITYTQFRTLIQQLNKCLSFPRYVLGDQGIEYQSGFGDTDMITFPEKLYTVKNTIPLKHLRLWVDYVEEIFPLFKPTPLVARKKLADYINRHYINQGLTLSQNWYDDGSTVRIALTKKEIPYYSTVLICLFYSHGNSYKRTGNSLEIKNPEELYYKLWSQEVGNDVFVRSKFEQDSSYLIPELNHLVGEYISKPIIAERGLSMFFSSF